MEATAKNGHALSVTEIAKLENLELVIDGGLKSFVEVGRALMEIRDGRLYRSTHMNFADYCEQRWGMSRQHADRLVAAADVVDDLTPIGVTPQCESQVRPLARLPEGDRASAWKEAVEAAPNGKPTAAIVEQVVASRLPEEDEPEQPKPAEDKRKKGTKERVEREAAKAIEKFNSDVSTVCDGSVYTLDALAKALKIYVTSVRWFVLMCDVSPSVKVHRNVGRKGIVQYTFEKTNCVTGHGRIRQLAQQIADDSSSGARSQNAARKILSLLGG